MTYGTPETGVFLISNKTRACVACQTAHNVTEDIANWSLQKICGFLATGEAVEQVIG